MSYDKRAYMKKWRAEHAEEIKNKRKKRYEEHREEERKRAHEYWKSNKDKIQKKHKEWISKNRNIIRETERKWRKKYRQRTGDATTKVKRAIKYGIIAPMPCEICGAPDAEAHHDDYNFPLKVRWLCREHHLEWHKENKPKYIEKEEQ